MTPKALRALIAKGEFERPTAGECPGYIQMNMVALPRVYAKRFEAFAKANSKAIPVLEIIDEGHHSKVLAPGADILREIPKYNILRDGVVVETVKDISAYANEDLVFFLIGCKEMLFLPEGKPTQHPDPNCFFYFLHTTPAYSPRKYDVSIIPLYKG